jgi:hypothetical protein
VAYCCDSCRYSVINDGDSVDIMVYKHNQLFLYAFTMYKMEPLLTKNDKAMFYKYLDKATVYFEYGTGGSTYQANLRNNIIKIYAVDSDSEWLNQQIKSDKLTLIYNDLNTIPNTYGHPGAYCTYIQKVNYSNQMRALTDDELKQIDLVFIDGRFRVACCLKCFDIIEPSCIILFDDFLNRPEYHVVLDYYEIIDKTNDERMVALRKKDGVSTIPSEIIERYETISI